jgi:hypothetical protein
MNGPFLLKARARSQREAREVPISSKAPPPLWERESSSACGHIHPVTASRPSRLLLVTTQVPRVFVPQAEIARHCRSAGFAWVPRWRWGTLLGRCVLLGKARMARKAMGACSRPEMQAKGGRPGHWAPTVGTGSKKSHPYLLSAFLAATVAPREGREWGEVVQKEKRRMPPPPREERRAYADFHHHPQKVPEHVIQASRFSASGRKVPLEPKQTL